MNYVFRDTLPYYKYILLYLFPIPLLNKQYINRKANDFAKEENYTIFNKRSLKAFLSKNVRLHTDI